MQLETLILINENLIAIQLILTSSRASERERERKEVKTLLLLHLRKKFLCAWILFCSKKEREKPMHFMTLTHLWNSFLLMLCGHLAC